jgi:hypothetical protein
MAAVVKGSGVSSALAHLEGGEKEDGQGAQQSGPATGVKEHITEIPLALRAALKNMG